MAASSSPANVKGPQVFINFRGAELRCNFVSNLADALKRQGINAFIDSDLTAGEKLETLYRKIDESTVALAILSSRYTESPWCLKELVKIKECVDRGTLWVIPIFYKLKTSMVHNLDGDFGLKLWNLWRTEDHNNRDDRILKWDAALQDIGSKKALKYEENSEDVVKDITNHVQNFLSREQNPQPQGSGGENPNPDQGSNQALKSSKPGEKCPKKLEEKLDVECNDNETRIVGLVGMVGIGKTYLAEELSKKLKRKISRYVFIKAYGLDHLTLQNTLVQGLLVNEELNFGNENALEVWKDRLLEKKVAVVLDDVREKEQVNAILGNCEWIKTGSRIIITTRDKSLLNGLSCDIYEVPKLNDRDSLELFRAQICTTLEGKFMELTRKFVDYAGGNPLALREFGVELDGEDEAHWETRLGTLTERIRKELRDSYDRLNEQEKDAFLDIAYFFRSQDENYIRSLLDSFDPESTEARKVLRGLADKFLISVCNGRVEMQDLPFIMAKELVEAKSWKYKLLSPSICAEFNSALEGRDKVRGIFLDVSKMEEMPLDNKAFVSMSSLRYLKVYDPDRSEANCKLNLPDGLEFPKDNTIRYLDWIKFSGKELPSDFKPKNLIDLRLPYSKITSLWNRAQVAPKLKWVDLSYSSKLTSISSLSDAPNLLRLNLEGCISLEELPKEMQKMKNLVFLNLRGCTGLVSLPNITMDSLKTLILSGCKNLQTFEVISEYLENLYLNGTAIHRLPSTIGNLHKLILLNLKDCENLVTLPDCVGKLKSLQEIKLSRCSKVKIFLEFKENMENLRLLLLDGTSIKEMPCSIINLSFLQRLCLSRNDNISNLQFDMSQLFHMKWLELKYCKNLTSLPKLPPNLQCLNAYGCTSLRTVASPLALITSTEQIQSTFVFTNCHELEQVSKDTIISYVQKKSQLMSEDRHNKDSLFKSLISACFPGCDVPTWFNHQAFGSVLLLEFPQDWSEGRLNGIALCVVVSFKDYKDHINGLHVKCTCEFTSVSLSRESFIIGGWSEPGDEPHTIQPDHVFIGYTNFFNTKKRQHFSAATEVSLGFEVTNGTHKVVECKVMKCGFTLVYEPDEVENTSWEANIDSNTRMENGKQGQVSSYRSTEDDDDDCMGEANSGEIPTTEEYTKDKGFFKSFGRSFRG